MWVFMCHEIPLVYDKGIRTTKWAHGANESTYVKQQLHRAMVAAVNLRVYLGIYHFLSQSIRHKKIIQPPTGVSLTCPEAVAPPTVRHLVWIHCSKSVYKAHPEQLRHLAPLLIGKASVITIGLGIFDIYLLMSYVQVTTNNGRLVLVEFFQIRSERILPLHTVR